MTFNKYDKSLIGFCFLLGIWGGFNFGFPSLKFFTFGTSIIFVWLLGYFSGVNTQKEFVNAREVEEK